MTGESKVEVPKYQSHKIVRAAKITEIQEHESDGTGYRTMIFGEIGGRQFLTDEWFERFKPEVGGYYVIYKDGYTSYSPAKAFEEGYTKIQPPTGSTRKDIPLSPKASH